MTNPLVSIIIPTKDSSNTLEACLVSLKKQSCKNIEIIVVDNNSADATKEIAKKYTDKVFNMGPERSAQRNYGVEVSNGAYVLIIDSDMELAGEVILECLNAVRLNRNIGGVIIPEESFGRGFWAQCKKLERSFYVGVEWMEAARFFSKSIYQNAGGYNEKMVSGEDWDLSQRVAKTGKLGRISEYIYHNEGKLSLMRILKKKMYYAKHLKSYAAGADNLGNFKNQAGIFKRYGLFFSRPGKLFKNPVIGLGMLFMKTCEFGFGGIGYIFSRRKD